MFAPKMWATPMVRALPYILPVPTRAVFPHLLRPRLVTKFDTEGSKLVVGSGANTGFLGKYKEDWPP